MSSRSVRPTVPLALALLGLAAVAVQLYSTRLGIGLSFDPVVYLTVAGNLLKGRGLTQAGQTLSHFPPLYPLLLALSGGLAGDLDLGARLLNALLWGANTFVSGLIVRRLTAGRLWPALLAAVLVLLSPAMLEIHASALSEPAFILLALLSLALLQRFGERRQRWLLWLSACAAGLAFLTRYVGGTLLAAGLLCLLTERERPLRARLIDCLHFGLVAGLPMAAWMVPGLVRAGTLADRRLYWHPVTLDHLVETLETLSALVSPSGWGGVALGAFVVVVLVALEIWLSLELARALRQGAALTPRHQSPLLYALFACVYLAGVVASVSLFDALTPFSCRILAPLYVALLIATLATIDLLTRAAGRTVRVASLLPFAALAIVYALYGAAAVQDAHANGQGFAHRRYQESAFVRYVRALPDDVPLLTNNRNTLYLLTGRSGTQLAQKYNPITLLPDERHPKLWARVVAEFRNKDGLVVYVSLGQPKDYQLTLEELLAVARFEVLHESEEGVVLRPLRKQDQPADR